MKVCSVLICGSVGYCFGGGGHRSFSGGRLLFHAIYLTKYVIPVLLLIAVDSK